MENKMKFKKGQRAWSSKHGWGVVVDFISQKNEVQFLPDRGAGIVFFGADGKWTYIDLIPTLFHKEQEYDFREPEIPIGTLGYFWQDLYQHRALIGHYAGLSDQGHRIKGGTCYENFCAYPELPPHLKIEDDAK